MYTHSGTNIERSKTICKMRAFRPIKINFYLKESKQWPLAIVFSGIHASRLSQNTDKVQTPPFDSYNIAETQRGLKSISGKDNISSYINI